MYGDCHVHMVLDGVYYKEAISRHRGRLDEVRPCLGCHEGCLGHIGKGPVSCAVNPACGRESIYGIVPAIKKKRILVVGGGVAGLEAARVAAIAGHTVILCEKTDQLGGNLIPRLGKKQPHPSFGMGLLLDAGGRNGCGTLKKGTFFANAHTNIFAALSKWLKTEKRKTNKLTGQSFFTAIRMIQIIRITRMVVDTNRRIQVYTKMERLTGRAAKRAAAEGIPPRNSRGQFLGAMPTAQGSAAVEQSGSQRRKRTPIGD